MNYQIENRSGKIDKRFSDSNRTHDRDQKIFRINCDPILVQKSISDFSGKIDPRFQNKNRSAIANLEKRSSHRRSTKSDPDFRTKIDQRFSDQNRSPIFIFKSISDFQIVIAPMIAIKKNPDRLRSDFGTEINQRFSDQNRSLIPRFGSGKTGN